MPRATKPYQSRYDRENQELIQKLLRDLSPKGYYAITEYKHRGERHYKTKLISQGNYKHIHGSVQGFENKEIARENILIGMEVPIIEVIPDEREIGSMPAFSTKRKVLVWEQGMKEQFVYWLSKAFQADAHQLDYVYPFDGAMNGLLT